jgi:EmrB/QacA subfamily drug resistance transporter
MSIVAHHDAARRSGVTVAVTAVAFFMVTLDALVVVTALPSIHRELGGSIGTLQWTVNAYSMAFAAGIITAAALGDRLGRRRVYVGGLALFTLASAACALAPDTSTLIAFRVVQGAGAAIIVPLGLTLLTSAFAPNKRGTVVGIWGGVAGLGVAAGPLIGGGVTQALSWHWVFWVNVPIGIVAAVAARLQLVGDAGSRTRLDLPALVLVAGGVATLVWGLVQAPAAGWSATRVVVALTVGIGLLLAFVWWETVAPEPMVPLALFRRAAFAGAVSTQFLTAAAIYSAAFITSEYFQFGRGLSPLSTGFRFLPWTAMPLLIAPAAGALFDRIGARRLAVPGLLLQAVGLAWIVHLADTAAGYGAYVTPFILAGIGISMALPCVSASALNAAPPEALGKAAGVLNTMQLFGATFGVAIAAVVFNANGALAPASAVASGFRPALAAAAGFSAVAAVVALTLRRRPAAQETEARAPRPVATEFETALALELASSHDT